MPSGNCDLDRALHVTLTFYIREIDLVVLVRGEKNSEIAARRSERSFAAQKLKRLSQILHAVNVDAIHHRGLGRVRFRNEKRLCGGDAALPMPPAARL